jgi:hypothetical protein
MIEWELDAEWIRTGRWRRRQFYALPGPAGLIGKDRRIPSDRAACEWRDPR